MDWETARCSHVFPFGFVQQPRAQPAGQLNSTQLASPRLPIFPRVNTYSYSHAMQIRRPTNAQKLPDPDPDSDTDTDFDSDTDSDFDRLVETGHPSILQEHA
jgi:hypothetical protein